MVGINAIVDHEATNANLREKNTYHNYRQQPEDYRLLQTIISGSIKAPDRLIHTGHVQTDICDHPQCRQQSERATTKHIMWHCPHYKETREPLLKLL